jgi:hypothetical protein
MIYDASHKLARRDMQHLLAENKELNIAEAAAFILTDQQALETVLVGLLSPQNVYRYNCFKVVLHICDQNPKILIPEWERFVTMLTSPNAYHRAIGIQIIASLSHADGERQLDGVFDTLFDLLDDESLITARQMALCAGKIAVARPDLESRVTARLLAIDQTHHSPQRKEMLKTDILQALSEYYPRASDKSLLLAFAQVQVNSKSSKTRKAARLFLNQR